MKSKNFSFFSFLSTAFCLCLVLYSCAKVEPIQECVTGQQYGFFSGLIHGFITPVSFIASLFKEEVAIYAVNNTGTLYDLGFLLGSGGWGFFAGRGARRR